MSVTRFLQEHTGWELAELKVAEEFWPTGGPAETLRALLIGRMHQAGKGDAEAARSASRAWKKLTGISDPATINNRGMAPAEMKLKMSGYE